MGASHCVQPHCSTAAFAAAVQSPHVKPLPSHGMKIHPRS
jgi:hypothetical protein